MAKIYSLLLVVVFAISVAMPAQAAGIYDDKKDGSLYNRAPPNEVMRLPKYCWGHYNPKFKGPKFNIDKTLCGPFTNHFCQGILRFNRSQNPMASKGERRKYLTQAAGNFDYTLNGLKDHPRCNIRKHVMIMRQKARMAVATPMP